MICLVDDSTLPQLRELALHRSVHACRIACLLDSYGLKYGFCSFWLQYDVDGRAVSAVSRYYSNVSVELTEESDITELRQFLDAVGYDSISAGEPLVSCGSTVTMRLEALKASTAGCDKYIEYEPELSEVYSLLSDCRSELAVPEYETFILDMSHKIRHGTALCTALRADGRLVSCAMTVAQSSVCAVIGAVVTLREYRGRGYGTACIQELCRRLAGREILIIREKDKNKEFYERAGFIELNERKKENANPVL